MSASRSLQHLACVIGLGLVIADASLGAQSRPIDLARSKLTVLVYKSGVFSAFADDHVINAPIARGSLSEQAPLSVQIAVQAKSLTVTDPNLPPSKRAEIQARMLGPEVLDTAKYAEITFTSTMVAPAGIDKWTVVGDLTIHGRTRSVTAPVVWQNGTYRGTIPIKLRDFGIEPITIAGGTVKVKDEIKIEFEIVPATATAARAATLGMPPP